MAERKNTKPDFNSEASAKSGQGNKEKSRPAAKSSRQFFQNLAWSKILAGGYLAVFYSAAIYLSVMTLATHQIQQKTKALSSEKAPIYFWLLEEVGEEDARLKATSDKKLETIDSSRNQLAELRLDFATVQPDYNAKRAAYTLFMNATLKPSGVSDFKDAHPDTYSVLEDKYNFLAPKLAIYAPSEQEQVRQKLISLRADFGSIDLKYKNLKSKIESLEAVLSLLDQDSFAHLKATKIILEEVYPSATDEYTQQIYMLAKEFRALKASFCVNIWGEPRCIFNSLATKQPEIVTLVLVLIMGALGGLIHLTQSFLDDEKTPPSYYIFRPILGILAAFSIFVLVKAGVLVVSGESFNETKSLNPFFVAFLGIVSGLMAQNAIMNLRQAGTNLFRSQSALDTRRWAIADPGNSVMDKLKEQPGKDIGKLAKILEKEQGQVEDWLCGRQRAPLNVQQAVASWLDKDIHELFHDLKTYKPDQKSEEQNS